MVYDSKWKEVNDLKQRMVVRRRGRFVFVVTSKGHRVEFDGVQLLLKLPVTYFGLVRILKFSCVFGGFDIPKLFCLLADEVKRFGVNTNK